MKITKKGKPAGKRKWIGRCRKCNSKAKAKQSEMTHITHNQHENDFSWEKCPVCGAGDKLTGYGGMLFCPAKGK